jgi:hypothetical protein
MKICKLSCYLRKGTFEIRFSFQKLPNAKDLKFFNSPIATERSENRKNFRRIFRLDEKILRKFALSMREMDKSENLVVDWISFNLEGLMDPDHLSKYLTGSN